VVRNGVRHGYVLSPILFLLILDRVMKRVKGLKERGIQWSMKERLEELDYADDICLLAQISGDTGGKLKRIQEEAESVGWHINKNKTKGMTVDTSNTQKFSLEDTEMEKVCTSVHLGRVV
jgi:hypothetical protein